MWGVLPPRVSPLAASSGGRQPASTMTNADDRVQELENTVRTLTQRMSALEERVTAQEAAIARAEETTSYVRGRRRALDRWADLEERSQNP